MNVLEYVLAIGQTTKRTEKENFLIDAYNNPATRRLFSYFHYAYNSFKTYGIKRIPESPLTETPDGWSIDEFDEEFFEVLERLDKREITGNDALNRVAKLSENCCPDHWNRIYAPILLRDLRVGAGVTTSNKILKKLKAEDIDLYKIPVFDCQAAHSLDPYNIEESLSTQDLPAHFLADHKLDGARMLVFLDKENEKVNCYSRGGMEKNDFTHLNIVFEGILKSLKTSYVLDGEVVSKSFSKVMSIFNAKFEKLTEEEALAKVSELEYCVFDIIPMEDFKNGICEIPCIDRDEILREVLELSGYSKNPFVRQIEKTEFLFPKDIESLDEYVRKSIKDGNEGVMIKDYAGPYECSRGYNWIKIKPYITVDLTIDEMIEGTGKYKGQLGALLCSGYDEDNQKQISTKIGSGLSDVQRTEWWGEDLVGKLVELQADGFTKSKDSKDLYSLRFPRKPVIREVDANGNKI